MMDEFYDKTDYLKETKKEFKDVINLIGSITEKRFGFTNSTFSYNGITATFNTDDTVVINGTCTEGFNHTTTSLKQSFPYVPNAYYKLSLKYISGSASINSYDGQIGRMYCSGTNNPNFIAAIYNDRINDDPKKAPSTSGNVNGFILGANEGAVFNNYKVKVSLIFNPIITDDTPFRNYPDWAEQFYDRLLEESIPITSSDQNYDADKPTGITEQLPNEGTTVEGKSLEINDANKYADNKIEIGGEIKQETTTGKNLFKSNPIATTTKNGITASYDKTEQTFTFNGTCTTDNTTFSLGNNIVEFVNGTTKSTTYWVSGSVSAYCQMRHFNADYTISNSYLITTLSSNVPSLSKTTTSTFTCPATQTTLRFNNGSVANNFKIKIMVANTENTSYEPFTNGRQPNPDYPSDVENVTGRQEINVRGKNLFDKNNSVQSGMLGSEGQYVVNNDLSYQNRYISVLPNTKYNMSSETSSIFRACEYDNSHAFIRRSASGSEAKSFTFTTSANTYYIKMAGVYNECINSLQIEKGEQATTYEKFKGGNYEINLGKNIINVTDASASKSSNGITATKNNGIITINGTATANSFIRFAIEPITLKAGTSYTFSINNSEVVGTDSNYACLRFNDGTNDDTTTEVKFNSLNNKLTITKTEDKTYTQICIRTINGLSYNNFTIYPQFEKGSSVTSFSSYKTPIELCKIGNYQDYIKKKTGKNIFNNEIVKKNQGNYTVITDTTLSTGKKLTYTSTTTTTDTRFVAYAVMDLTNYVGKTIRMKANFKASSSNTGRYLMGLCNSDGSNRTVKTELADVSGTTIEFTVPELNGSQKYLLVNLYVNGYNGTIVQNDYVDYTDVIITIDNGDLTYEPYGSGKNLFDGIVEQGTISGSDGQPSSSTERLRTANYIIVKPNTTYTISTSTSNIDCVAFLYGENKNYLERTATTFQTMPYTITTSQNTKYIKFALTKHGGGTFTPSDVSNVMINEGSSVIPYEPFGSWYIEKKIGKVVLNGSETWTAQGWTGRSAYRTTISDIFIAPNANTSGYIKSNRFTNYTQNEVFAKEEIKGKGISLRNGVSEIIIRNDDYTTVANFKTWLTTNNTSVYYVLNTPTYETITDAELDSQLNQIELLSELNNISTDSWMPTLKLTYNKVDRATPDTPLEIIPTKTIGYEIETQETGFVEGMYIDLGDEELNGSSETNMYDKIIFNNGDWYYSRNIGKLVLDGTENDWQIDTSGGYPKFTLEGVEWSGNIFSLCKDFTYDVNNTYTLADGNWYTYFDNGIATGLIFNRPIVNGQDISTLQDWLSWLSTHNLTIYYQLEDTVNTKITDSEIVEQLDIIKDYFVSDGVLGFIYGDLIKLKSRWIVHQYNND